MDIDWTNIPIDKVMMRMISMMMMMLMIFGLNRNRCATISVSRPTSTFVTAGSLTQIICPSKFGMEKYDIYKKE